jgi:hypothetical protein
VTWRTDHLASDGQGHPERQRQPGKLAHAELHFDGSALAGLKLIGFSIWERRDGPASTLISYGPLQNCNLSGLEYVTYVSRPSECGDSITGGRFWRIQAVLHLFSAAITSIPTGSIFAFLAPAITPTRQEVFFFGTPAGDLRFTETQLPTWIDGGKRPFFGVPGNHWRGFKIADDTRGPIIDPSTMDRQISAEKLVLHRFEYDS